MRFSCFVCSVASWLSISALPACATSGAERRPASAGVAAPQRVDPQVDRMQVMATRVAPAPPSAGATRTIIELANGERLAFWTEGSQERGRRAMVQSLDIDGVAIGTPVSLSSPDMDVFGTPRAVSVDDHGVMATFYAFEAGASELVAVSVHAP